MTDDREAAARARLGHTLGDKWTLESLLGIGAMAAVYAGKHRNGAKAAIKVLHPHLSIGDAGGRVKVLDFGLARISDDAVSTLAGQALEVTKNDPTPPVFDDLDESIHPAGVPRPWWPLRIAVALALLAGLAAFVHH